MSLDLRDTAGTVFARARVTGVAVIEARGITDTLAHLEDHADAVSLTAALRSLYGDRLDREPLTVIRFAVTE